MDHQEARESAFKKVQILIKQFNETFDIEANIIKDEKTGEEITDGFKIKGLKNDGSAFLDEIFNTLVQMVRIASDDHELVYDAKRGFAIAKKITSYELI